jgi:hypothetical protein
MDGDLRRLDPLGADADRVADGVCNESTTADPPYRADAIETYPAPSDKHPRVSEQLEEPAENALHLVPVRVADIPLSPKVRFERTADGRLRRPAATAPRATKTAERDKSAALVPLPPDPPPLILAPTTSLQDSSADKGDAPKPPQPPVLFASTLKQPPGPVDLVAPPTNAVPSSSGEAAEENFKPIGELNVDISPSRGEFPRDVAGGVFKRQPTIPQVMGYSREGVASDVHWQPPALCYRPLLFEEVNLERHGHQLLLAQPFLSAAHFFSRVPSVPYLVVSERGRVCNYTLGHYSPGSCAPYVWYYPRFSLDAATVEAALITGLIYVVP